MLQSGSGAIPGFLLLWWSPCCLATPNWVGTLVPMERSAIDLLELVRGGTPAESFGADRLIQLSSVQDLQSHGLFQNQHRGRCQLFVP